MTPPTHQTIKLSEEVLGSKTVQERLAELEDMVGRVRDTLGFWHQAGMPEKTLLILLNHYTKVPQRDIRLVLAGLDALYEEYFDTGGDDE